MNSTDHSLIDTLSILCPFLLLGVLGAAVHAQTTLTLQPDGSTGQDARLNNLYDYPMNERAELPASTWKWNAIPGIDRSIIRFDLSSIDQGAGIDEAMLYLFGSGELPSGPHSTLGGANTFNVLRVVSPWNEQSVSWSTQPAVSLLHQVTVYGSASPVQNYAINVTQLVRDMRADPDGGYGFMIKLASELFDPCANGIGYRRINFASSNHSDPLLRPKLVVRWSRALSVESCPAGMQMPTVYPNPTNGLIAVGGTGFEEVVVCDIFGRMLASRSLSGSNLLDLSRYQPGVYFFRFRAGYIEQSVKVIKM
jgi:hypothetical protein